MFSSSWVKIVSCDGRLDGVFNKQTEHTVTYPCKFFWSIATHSLKHSSACKGKNEYLLNNIFINFSNYFFLNNFSWTIILSWGHAFETGSLLKPLIVGLDCGLILTLLTSFRISYFISALEMVFFLKKTRK